MNDTIISDKIQFIKKMNIKFHHRFLTVEHHRRRLSRKLYQVPKELEQIDVKMIYELLIGGNYNSIEIYTSNILAVVLVDKEGRFF